MPEAKPKIVSKVTARGQNVERCFKQVRKLLTDCLMFLVHCSLGIYILWPYSPLEESS